MQTPGPSQQKKWTSYKLLLDPQIKKGQQKLYRYDGVVPGPLVRGPPYDKFIEESGKGLINRYNCVWKFHTKHSGNFLIALSMIVLKQSPSECNAK